MKNIRTIMGIAAVLCVCAFIAVPASAFFQNGETSPGGRMDRGTGPGPRLDRLEEQGYDVSAIRAAVESGDTETVRTLLQQFMEEHKGELPACPHGRTVAGA